MDDVSHEYVYDAYFCNGTIFIQDQVQVQSLWKHGSYGKGHISAREPQKNIDILHLTLLEGFFLLYALNTINITPCLGTTDEYITKNVKVVENDENDADENDETNNSSSSSSSKKKKKKTFIF